MAYFHTTVLDNQIKALPTVGTASGSIATFETDMTENLVEVVCDIQYQQASGTPTPQSPIPITTYTSLNLSHSGADTSNPTVYNIPFGQTVAKGTLNVNTGVLEITHEILTLDGTESISLTGTATNRRFRFNNTLTYNALPLSSHFIEIDSNTSPWGYYRFVSSYLMLLDVNSQMADETALKTWLANQYSGDTPVQFLCELAIPKKVQLDSITIQALLNENNIWCDTNGDTIVKFLLTIGKAIS